MNKDYKSLDFQWLIAVCLLLLGTTSLDAQNCNTELAYWSLDNCFSNSNTPGSGDDYSEFTASIITPNKMMMYFLLDLAFQFILKMGERLRSLP